MSITIDCGEGKHKTCSGSGTQPYLIPQEAGDRFYCGCSCHHSEGAGLRGEIRGVACVECYPASEVAEER